MTLQERITDDLKTAMRNKDEAGKRGIRAIKQAILLQQTDGSGTTLDEAGEIALLQKLVKSRQESLEIYEQQGRDDLAQPEREEIEVISRYLPEAPERRAARSPHQAGHLRHRSYLRARYG